MYSAPAGGGGGGLQGSVPSVERRGRPRYEKQLCSNGEATAGNVLQSRGWSICRAGAALQAPAGLAAGSLQLPAALGSCWKRVKCHVLDGNVSQNWFTGANACNRNPAAPSGRTALSSTGTVWRCRPPRLTLAARASPGSPPCVASPSISIQSPGGHTLGKSYKWCWGSAQLNQAAREGAASRDGCSRMKSKQRATKRAGAARAGGQTYSSKDV